MKTKVISLKEYRNNITSLWKESREKNIRYIVLHHSKPILDVRPYLEDELVFEEDLEKKENNDYYKTLEGTLSFWNDDCDNNIFLTEET